jgi:tRNA-dihydrouridine synthase B
VHGRTRECRYLGNAEYDTIAAIKQAIDIPVFANGDICSAQQAKQVLDYTGADGVMIGRGAQGKPWLFREINAYLATGVLAAPAAPAEIKQVLLSHLSALYRFYGEQQGLRIARKHCAWYLQELDPTTGFRGIFNRLESPSAQQDAVHRYFEQHEQNLQEAAA